MHFQFEVAPPTPMVPPMPPPTVPSDGLVDLLRQMLDVQKQLLELQRSAQTTNDHLARWRNLLGRWQEDYPQMADRCRQILPNVERGYLRMIDDLANHLQAEDHSGIEDDFSLNEFLDRYGMRIAQLGTILHIVGTLADAGNPPEQS